MNVFINGNIISEDKAYIHLKDRGLLLGDGIFETCKADHGRLFFLDKHYERLRESAKFLAIPLFYSNEQISEACKTLLEANRLINTTAAIRITLTRGEGLRGINIPNETHPTLFITAIKYINRDNFPSAFITSIKRNSFSPIVKHKTLNYLEPILARAEAQSQGFDEGIMLNVEGFISECSTANIFFIHNGTVITPDLESGILPGITRAQVINLCKTHDIPIIERKIPISDALNCEEAFQTNSLIGIQPLSAINNKKLSIKTTNAAKAISNFYDEFQAHGNRLQVTPRL